MVEFYLYLPFSCLSQYLPDLPRDVLSFSNIGEAFKKTAR